MTLQLPGLPALSWTNGPGVATFAADILELTAAPGVDWSNDSLGGPQQHAATALVFAAPADDFILSARVQVPGERTTFDAGALALWSDEDHWAKLCFEYSPQGQPMVVSVVTDRFSDDVNSAPVDDAHVYLRVARVGPACAFHASTDGIHWDFVRLFRLPEGSAPLRVGFLSQAPMGEACVARFDEISLAERRLDDRRDGS